MRGEAFYWILNMSVASSLAGAVILLLRKIKKFPRRLVFILWAVPFLRMWMPFSVGSRYGLMGLLARAGVRTVTVYEETESFTAMNCVGAADSYFPVVYKVNVLENVFNGAFALTLVECAADMPLFASAFGGADLHKRICRILSYRKISVFSMICFAVLAAGIAWALLTNGI